MKKIVCLVSIILTVLNLYAQIIGYRKLGSIEIEIYKDTIDAYRYSGDNKIYTLGKLFEYSYIYKTEEGKPFLFRYWNKKNNNSWAFVSYDENEDTIVDKFTLHMCIKDPFDGSRRYDQIMEPYQSVIRYSMFNKGQFPASSRTGLIENEKNIWLHPPRSHLFRILELNPFPYIKFPATLKKKWTWSLTIGEQWGDSRWREWKGAIHNKYRYVISDTAYKLSTSLGDLTCVKIESSGKSKLGKTHLISYFHEIYGFIKYEYINIDGTTIEIELTKVTDKQ